MRIFIVAGALPLICLLLPTAGVGAPQEPTDPTAVATDAPVAAPEAAYQPMTAKQRWAAYVRESLISPRLGGSILLSATISHFNRDPKEWGMGPLGYLHRVESHWAVNALQGSLHSAGAAALGHDTRYQREPDADGVRRVRHALWRTFFTRDREGRWTPDSTNLASLYAAPMIGTAWHPRRYGALHQGLRAGDFSVAAQAGTNLIKEFGPDLMQIFRHK